MFAGIGSQVITLEEGSPASIEPGVVHASHDGSSNFQVTVLDDQGQQLDGLINEIGPYDGRRPWSLSDSEIPRFIEVNADGNWILQVMRSTM